MAVDRRKRFQNIRRFFWSWYSALPEVQTRRQNIIKAQNKLNTAVKSGKLKRPRNLKCQHCNQDAYDYHHTSYDTGKELQVIPLCKPCHSLADKIGTYSFRERIGWPSLTEYYQAVLSDGESE